MLAFFPEISYSGHSPIRLADRAYLFWTGACESTLTGSMEEYELPTAWATTYLVVQVVCFSLA